MWIRFCCGWIEATLSKIARTRTRTTTTRTSEGEAAKGLVSKRNEHARSDHRQDKNKRGCAVPVGEAFKSARLSMVKRQASTVKCQPSTKLNAQLRENGRYEPQYHRHVKVGTGIAEAQTQAPQVPPPPPSPTLEKPYPNLPRQ